MNYIYVKKAALILAILLMVASSGCIGQAAPPAVSAKQQIMPTGVKVTYSDFVRTVWSDPYKYAGAEMTITGRINAFDSAKKLMATHIYSDYNNTMYAAYEGNKTAGIMFYPKDNRTFSEDGIYTVRGIIVVENSTDEYFKEFIVLMEE